jgi:hypothetical protein
MRLILGILAILLAIVFGLVEFRALADPTVAQTISNGFAVHDPFPRLPWDYHVIFVLFFLGLLSLNVCRRRPPPGRGEIT